MPVNYEAIAHTYNLVLLYSRAKVDPFLDVIDDHKLQAVSFAPDNLIAYGSKEDTDRALETLSELSTFNHQDQELFVSEIVRSLVNLSEPELSSMREALLKEFSPDDMCPLGSQLTMDIPEKD
ncbi:hypothetical protein JHK87_027493 [Glycine soja]|nr:hypothetical protein JHK87_027493 [Glycine soja]